MDNQHAHKKVYTAHQARLKAESYCAYQERAQQEVRDKLYDWGLHTNDVENIIADLISDNYLNEERFAIAFTLGKFRMKNWGKIKISQHLKIKRIPSKMIKTALEQIDYDEYLAAIDKLIASKTTSHSLIFDVKTKSKLYNYLAVKGYESTLIMEKLHQKTSG